jgi:hypothetical protein
LGHPELLLLLLPLLILAALLLALHLLYTGGFLMLLPLLPIHCAFLPLWQLLLLPLLLVW